MKRYDVNMYSSQHYGSGVCNHWDSHRRFVTRANFLAGFLLRAEDTEARSLLQ